MIMKTSATIISTKVICKQPDRYIGWPTIIRTRMNELLVVFSGDREGHVCPWGKTQMIRSQDNGESWSSVSTVSNTPLDDRDAGIVETQDGTLLVFHFSDVGFDQWPCSLYSKQTYDSWRRHSGKLDAAIRKQWLGPWVRRSVTNGHTWEGYSNTIVSCSHGATQLADGRILMAGHPLNQRGEALTVVESCDDGLTWHILTMMPHPTIEGGFGEVNILEYESNRLIALMRHQHPDISKRYLWQSTSSDGGRTWCEAVKTGMLGYPPHMVALQNGWIVVVYGLRIDKQGIWACLSRDAGMTWDVDTGMCISKAPNGDLGYPASVQLEDGSIYTVFYQVDTPGEKPCLMATHWQH